MAIDKTFLKKDESIQKRDARLKIYRHVIRISWKVKKIAFFKSIQKEFIATNKLFLMRMKVFGKMLTGWMYSNRRWHPFGYLRRESAYLKKSRSSPTKVNIFRKVMLYRLQEYIFLNSWQKAKLFLKRLKMFSNLVCDREYLNNITVFITQRMFKKCHGDKQNFQKGDESTWYIEGSL